MTGPVEEAGKVASGFIDALKAQPAVLALTVANIGMMVFIFYALHAGAVFRQQLIENQYTLMRETSQLLAKCVVPDKQTYTTEPLKPIGDAAEPHKEIEP